MPGQGVTGMFRFGYGTGFVAGILAALDVRTVRVKPAVWKSAMGLSHLKSESVTRANILFKREPHFLKRDDGIAEAALIAHFALTKLGSLAETSIYE